METAQKVALMPAYIGHYMCDPESWFFIVAPNPEAALVYVDCEWGQPDPRSLKLIDTMVGVNFYAKLKESEDDSPRQSFPLYWTGRASDDELGRNHETLCLGGCGDRADAEDWVHLRLVEALDDPDEGEYDILDAFQHVPLPLSEYDLLRKSDLEKFRRRNWNEPI